MRSNKGFLDPFQRKHIRKTVTITIIYRNREKERVKVRGREIERETTLMMMIQNGSFASKMVPDSFKACSTTFIPARTFSSSILFPTICTPSGRPCIFSALYSRYAPLAMALN